MKKLDLEYPESVKNCLVNIDNFVEIENVKTELVYTDSNIERPIMSILMPTFNALYVTEALKSAAIQKGAPEYEIVIVDNDSEEQYLTNIVNFAKKLNCGRVSVYKNSENVGMYGNWNRAIQLAKADYITYLHSDDLLTETCLKDLWDFHCSIEEDAAIITQEKITYMDGRVIYEYKPAKTKFGGLLKPKEQNRRKKIQLLFPHGNGCGHFFSKKVLMELGGYSKSGDQGCVLRYNISHPVYDLSKITRIKRIGENESAKVASRFIPFGYYLRQQVIEKEFHNCSFLHYLSRLEAENTAFPEYGVKAKRKLSKFELWTLGNFKRYVNLISKYTLF